MKHGDCPQATDKATSAGPGRIQYWPAPETEVCELAYLEAGQVRLVWLKRNPHCGAKAFEVRERLRMATGTEGA